MSSLVTISAEELVLVSLLIVCLLGSHMIIRARCSLLPESSVAIVAGAAFGAVLSQLDKSKEDPDFWKFEPDIFFQVLLPPIIFEAGYSLKRRLFLANITPIVAFAVFGTIISTIILAATLQLGGALHWIGANVFDGINSATGLHGSMLFAALLSAVDPVATLAVLSSAEVNADTTVQAIIFGESVLNDAVSIVLYQTIESASHPDAASVYGILGSFIRVSLGATGVGVAVALALSLVLRHGTLYERSAHIEVGLTLAAAYLAYALSEAAQLSGILSLFFCGVTLGHYNWYNLSDAARLTTAHTTRTLAYLSETLVFAYLGLSAADPRAWHGCDWGFVGMTLVGCIVGRILNIFPLAALVNCCRRPDDQVSLRGQLLMSFAGLRGAIAFALALTFPEPGRQLVISATIVTVLSSTMVLGGLTAPLVRLLKLNGADDATATESGAPTASSASHLASPPPSLAASRNPSHAPSQSVHQPLLPSDSLLPPDPTSRGPEDDAADDATNGQHAAPASGAAHGHAKGPKPRRSWLHTAWRRLDRRYLQPLFGGAASASARRRPAATELFCRATLVASRRQSSRLRRGGETGGGSGATAFGSGLAGGSCVGGGGGGFWEGHGSAAAGSAVEGADKSDDDDDDEDEAEVEAERDAAEEMMMLVRACSNDAFVLRSRSVPGAAGLLPRRAVSARGHL